MIKNVYQVLDENGKPTGRWNVERDEEEVRVVAPPKRSYPKEGPDGEKVYTSYPPIQWDEFPWRSAIWALSLIGAVIGMIVIEPRAIGGILDQIGAHHALSITIGP